MAKVYIDVSNFDKVVNAIQEFGDGAENVINSYLHNEGADTIKESIHNLLPASGRRWKGKKTAAKDTDPFQKRTYNLAVEVHTTTNYNYLYFPDDGSNTVRHYGGQDFMLRGAEASSQDIVDNIIQKLTKDF